MINLTREQFRAMYGEVHDEDIFFTDPKNEEELWSRFMVSKLWRLCHLYTVTDKMGDLVRFNMNKAQHKVYRASISHPRIIVLKSRQQGISTLWLVSFFDDALFSTNYEIGLMNLGLKESKTLFRRIKRLWSELPSFVKDYIGLELVKETQDELGFNNGSMMYLASSFRSGTLQRLHISEFGKIAAKTPEKARETKTGSLQAIKAGNTVVVESTAEGRANEFYDMWYSAAEFKGARTGKDFLPVFLSWTEDEDCRLRIPQKVDDEAMAYFIGVEKALGIELLDEQKWWWVSQKRELKDSMGQEYPATPEEAFSAVRDGTYYSRLYRELVVDRGREVDGLYDPSLDVEVVMDLGINDVMVLIFFQRHMREIRLIDCYYNSGEGLEHYATVMKTRTKELRYRYGTVWAPHDAQVRELGTGLTRVARMRELGIRVKVLPKANVLFGIEQVRKMLEWVYIDPTTCKLIVDTMYAYSKEWDDKGGVWRDKPLHNFWSNPADALRYLAMSKGSGKDRSAVLGLSGDRRTMMNNVVDGLAL